MARKTLPFVRTIVGYQPDSVREALTALEQFYRTEELAAQSHLWDVVRSLEFMKPLVETAEEICQSVSPGSAGELDAVVMPGTKPVALPEPPPMPIREAWFGYRPGDVNAVIDAYRKRCEGELADLLRETAEVEAERTALNNRLTRALARLRKLAEEPRGGRMKGLGKGRVIAIR